MQYQYQPNISNQPHYAPHNTHYQYPSQYNNFSNYAHQQYDPNVYSHYRQTQPQYYQNVPQQTFGYWPPPHNMPAVIQRERQRSQTPLIPLATQAKVNAPIHQVVYQQEQLNPPQSIRQVEYVPYQKRYIDYVAQRVQVPVQKYMTDYYQIEHVVDFVPRQYQDTVVQMVPEQVIRYRLQYVPVEKKIVHMNKEDVVNFEKNTIYGQKIQQMPISTIQHKNQNSKLHKQVSSVIPVQRSNNRVDMEGSRVSNRSNLSRRSRKTNYVTADNYNPSYREDQLYQQSRVIKNQTVFNNLIDDRFKKRETQMQNKNTFSQSSESRFR